MAKKSKDYIVYDANSKFKKDVIELLEDILETLNSKNNTEQIQEATVTIDNEVKEAKPKTKRRAKKKEVI